MLTAIYQALCACLGLSPSSDAASTLIRQAYDEPENAPRPPRSADVIYYTAEPDGAGEEPPPAYAAENPSSSSHTPTVTSFSAYRLLITCYGPNAESNARKIRALLYIDGANFPRGILRKSGLYPVPNPPEVLLLHEPEGSLWRRRADLTIQLHLLEIQTHPNRRNAVTVAPAITIHTNR